jgi:hypothetical protein
MAVSAKKIHKVVRLPEMVVEDFGGEEYAYIPLGLPAGRKNNRPDSDRARNG